MRCFPRDVKKKVLFSLDQSTKLLRVWDLKVHERKCKVDTLVVGAKKLLSEREPSIPLIPGYNGDDQSIENLSAKALEIGTQTTLLYINILGFPVLLKASAGGGGKGMRIVREKSELKNAIDSAKSEAKNSFGDDFMLIEKYFDSVKHIEFQIFGDNYGNVIHLFERECSVQRRHQKVIEV
jgi:3-methylcrotonyl-CoA carboxylase alpha subunit